MAEPVRFYYREGCHLCEEMAAHLFRDWPDVAQRMEWTDVDSSPTWLAQYGHRVPVLSLGNRVVCEYFLDTGQMDVHFGRSSNPV